MGFEVLSVDDNRWPDLVRQAGADIFYEPSYCRFETDGTPHRAIMMLYQDDLGTVFDVTVEKSVASLPFFGDIAAEFTSPPIDIASPDYNSPIILSEPGSQDELLKRYRHAVDHYCLERGVVTEFVRFHPMSATADTCAQYLQVTRGAELLYVNLTNGYDHAHEGYRKGHRSTIKKAARDGADFRLVPPTDPEALARLFQLYTETMQRKGAKSVYLLNSAHFDSMSRHLEHRILLMESLFRDQVASVNVFLLGQKHMWFKYSGLDQQLRNTGAHTFMMDRAFHWASNHGFEHVMLGGGIVAGDSTYASKRGFTHTSAPVHHGKKIHNPRLMSRLIQAKQSYDSRLGLPTAADYFPSYWLT
jgi:hypothetical protein